MTGGIAHDFRNILAIIESGLILAEKNSEQPESARIYIAGAREGVNRGLKLTSQLLSFAKQQELEAHAGNANDFLKNLEVFLKYGAGPGIRIMSKLAPDLPMCLIDPAQFNAAILNLVLNARDAMPHGGDIRISTMRRAEKSSIDGSLAPGLYVQVQVKDTGQGMSAETAQKIFDPFFTTKGENGTGLGLPQVRAFMRLIGGHVRVVSEPGVGTVFDLLFPALQADTYGETVEAMSVNNNLWRQIDRWVNEGGAVGDGTAPSAKV
jgi:signal transduction histidine kinase